MERALEDKDCVIKQMEQSMMLLRDKSNLFLGRYEHTKVLEEVRDVLDENDDYH
jgi:hypothetical protein